MDSFVIQLNELKQVMELKYCNDFEREREGDAYFWETCDKMCKATI